MTPLELGLSAGIGVSGLFNIVVANLAIRRRSDLREAQDDAERFSAKCGRLSEENETLFRNNTVLASERDIALRLSDELRVRFAEVKARADELEATRVTQAEIIENGVRERKDLMTKLSESTRRWTTLNENYEELGRHCRAVEKALEKASKNDRRDAKGRFVKASQGVAGSSSGEIGQA